MLIRVTAQPRSGLVLLVMGWLRSRLDEPSSAAADLPKVPDRLASFHRFILYAWRISRGDAPACAPGTALGRNLLKPLANAAKRAAASRPLTRATALVWPVSVRHISAFASSSCRSRLSRGAGALCVALGAARSFLAITGATRLGGDQYRGCGRCLTEKTSHNGADAPNIHVRCV
jgi:hypothetical protein